MSESRTVYVRVKPTCEFADDYVNFGEDGQSVTIKSLKKQKRSFLKHQISSYSFQFASILQNSDQQSLFNLTTKPSVDNALNGINSCIICNGGPGSGKTFTLNGEGTEYAKRGLIPRAIQYIFQRVATQPELETAGETLSSGGTTRGGKELSAESAKYFEDAVFNFDVQTDERFGNVEGSLAYKSEDPVSAADNGLTVSDLRGKDFYDDVWNDWLDQIDYDDPEVVQQIIDLSALANYATTGVTELGLPRTTNADGANGIKVFKTDSGMDLTSTFSMTPVWASTWNVELLGRVGEMLGKEALENNVNGWYSPAINLHRSPFSGRNFEYYSEDPLLTGKIAAAVVSGASESGLICYIKHFALNDQETNRNNYISTWADEQTMRELYLKAFEIPFKESTMTINYITDENGTMAQRTMRAATAAMASQNCIGQYYGHSDYRLLTGLLRSEWGFNGMITSDMFSMSKADMYDMSYRAGLDTFLATGRGQLADSESASAHHMFRRILHDVGYAVANSNAMQGVAPGTIFYYDISPWVLYLQLPLNIVFGLLIAGAIAWMIIRTVRDKKNAAA